jgi:hypothetical protein
VISVISNPQSSFRERTCVPRWVNKWPKIVSIDVLPTPVSAPVTSTPCIIRLPFALFR